MPKVESVHRPRDGSNLAVVTAASGAGQLVQREQPAGGASSGSRELLASRCPTGCLPVAGVVRRRSSRPAQPMGERLPAKPPHPHAAGKYAAEMAIEWQARAGSMSAVRR